MIQIRRAIFETNSSSTHSLVMCSKKEYEDFNNGKLYVNKNVGPIFTEYPKLVTIEQIREIAEKLQNDPKYSRYYDDSYKNMSDEELINDYFCNFLTVDEFFEDSLESFEEEYTTPNGETVIAFGVFGYDG